MGKNDSLSASEIEALLGAVDQFDESSLPVSNSSKQEPIDVSALISSGPKPPSKLQHLLKRAGPYLKNNPVIYQDGGEYYIKVEDLQKCFINLTDIKYKKT